MSSVEHPAMAGYAAERRRLLASLTRLLDQDERVLGVWLRGSLGRGEGDDVSDIDLHVAIDDRACGAILADVGGFLAQSGRLLLVQTVFSAPRGGFTRCVLYPGAHGPQQVDWMVWPHSVAVLHPPAQAMFIKAPIRTVQSERYETLVDQSPGEAGLGHGLATCWLFVLIAARYLARGWDSAVLTMLRSCVQATHRTTVGTSLPPVPDEVESGADAVTLLREFSAGLRRAMPGTCLAGDFASPEAIDAIDRFVEVVASARHSGGVSAT